MIANSLSITIAQRTRELATLRTLGATRRQVLTSIVVEALVVGALASVIGLFLGLGLAKGLFSLFDAVGFTLPNSGLRSRRARSSSRCWSACSSTLVASLRPAIRATRVPPIAAVREGATLPPSRFARYRTIGSILLDRRRVRRAPLRALRSRASARPGSCVWMGVGALLIFFGVALLRRAARAAARARRSAGRRRRSAAPQASLARDNARRNPQRTASTASALMIGLALVTLVAVLAAGITLELPRRRQQDLANADYAITAQNNFTPDPGRGCERRREEPGRRGGRQRPHRRRCRVRQRVLRDRRQPGREHDVQPRLERRAASRRWRRSATTARSSTRTTRRATTCGPARRSC